VAVLPVLPREAGAGVRRAVQAASLRLAALLSAPAAGARLAAAVAAAAAAADVAAPVAMLLEPDAKLSRLLSAAAAGGADVALLVAEDELRAGAVAVKDLRAGAQRAVPLPRAARPGAGAGGAGGGSSSSSNGGESGDDDDAFWQALGEADAARRGLLA